MLWALPSPWQASLGLMDTHYVMSGEGNGTHSSTLAWKIPWMEEPGRLQSMGPWGSDTTERLHFHFPLSCIGEGNGNLLQCSCLENPRDAGARWAPFYGVTQSRTRLKRLSSSSSICDVKKLHHSYFETLLPRGPLPLFHPQWRQNKRDTVSGKDSSGVAPAQLCGGLLVNISGLKLIFNITNQNYSQLPFSKLNELITFFFFNPLYHLCVASFWEPPALLKHSLQAETEKSVSLGHPCPTALRDGLRAASTFTGSLAHPAMWCRRSLSTFSALAQLQAKSKM